MSGESRVEAIFVSTGTGQSMRAVPEAQALDGRGLAGDRYHLGTGRYSHKPGPDRHVTLIEAEALEELSAAGLTLAPGEHRRNVVTRGVGLNHLVGRDFRVGALRLRGVRMCHPCAYLEGLTGRPGLVQALADRGGLRTEILSSGMLRVGDSIRVTDEANPDPPSGQAVGAGDGRGHLRTG